MNAILDEAAMHWAQHRIAPLLAEPVVFAILSGKRSLNWRQFCGISDRFGVPTDVFRERRV